MRKYLLIIMISVFELQLYAQDNTIGIGLIIDNKTGLSKSFAFHELLSQNPLSKNRVVLQPKLIPFVYTSAFGIEGVFYDNNVNLKLYQNGKKIKDIKCNNDWEVIFSSLATEVEKADGFKPSKKFQNITEGKQANFYSKRIVDNLPGKLTIQVPNSKLINYKSFTANMVKFNSRNPYTEIVEIYGKFGTSDINEIDVFKSGSVPANFKTTIKPLVYPISKTMTYSLKLLGYGGLLTEQKDYGAALNCFYTALNTTKEMLASEKEAAVLKSFIFKNISDIYGKIEGKRALSSMYMLGFDLNNDFSNSVVAEKSNENYYSAISKAEALCESVDLNLRASRNAAGLMMLGAVTNGLSASSGSLNSLGYDVSSLTNNLGSAASQSTDLQSSSAQFFSQLSEANDWLNAESFLVEGLERKAENNYISSEVLYYLMTNPMEVKVALSDFAKDKPRLNTLLSTFYSSKEGDKKKQIQEIYVQLSKVEMVITGLEGRNKTIEEKYKSNF